ncbi:hypothetical protein C5C42_13105 [Rathayibacter sp. AY1F7]|nr:hypothetical protein C5C54_03410 [Rathayibacter sp. AY1F2]PPG38948.1 hypothetical protein C5C30_11155 [Rathayibacter sp. AY2B5]PPG98961.1 hypothetical protein C5C32_13130 [Rathayibacter sp. AY1G9]PPH43784.1 hypothetical protein C5C42_13105 [Rathayibacter sp. AY1F7]PPH87066.1 hypothetical protein C5C64_14140 [Rathayibacter sp. AY1D3]
MPTGKQLIETAEADCASITAGTDQTAPATTVRRAKTPAEFALFFSLLSLISLDASGLDSDIGGPPVLSLDVHPLARRRQT